jgi:isopenicillin-N N-acyltransferase-like protein
MTTPAQAEPTIARDWDPPAAFPLGRFEGGPRDVGRAHGRTFGDRVLGSIRAHRASIERTGLAWPDALVWAQKGRELMELLDLKLADELTGIAEGAEVDPREIFAINFRVALTRVTAQSEKMPEIAECTTGAAMGAVTADGHTLLAQNWDQSSELQANLVVIEQRIPGQPALLFVTEAGRMILHGMNDAGVGIVGNSLSCDRPTQPVKSAASATARRRALRHTSVAAAHRTMIDTTHGTSGNHLLADSTGEAYDVEAIPDGAFSLEPENGVIAHSNHYLHPEARTTIVDKNVKAHPSTIYRESRLRGALSDGRGTLTVADVQTALRDHYGFPTSVCTHPHPNGRGGTGHTLASTVMDLNDRRMFTAPGPACLGTYTEYRFSA